jgi:hypothetical protein
MKELEHDFVAGKLDDADYAEMRALLSREALQALRSARGEAPDAVAAPEAAERLHVCGFENAPDSRFCAGCGAALE